PDAALPDRDQLAQEWLKRPQIRYAPLRSDLVALGLMPLQTDDQVVEQVEIQVKYAGYINRQQQEVERQQAQEGTEIPLGIDYQSVAGLSVEVRQKLEQIRPVTLGQASRISGVTPAAISLLMIHLRRLRRDPAREVLSQPGAAADQAA
ncbi:MAG: tRNA uridine-5-carboxymethylaminomethyl(34) synthesis enzyme MnmG, partial [Betaproteobacteria bacterium]|nr:tRNA uridine-5-carboxymethylaminomethyl(34) synthesis enzyme MnmG [Betaproteobacteria bacterium]